MLAVEENIQYLSHFLNENTQAYGGEIDCIKFERTRSISNGDTSNNLKLTFPNHIGTHIDFPYHFNSNGKKCNNYIPNFWIFNKVGLLISEVENIDLNLNNINENIEILLLKTGFENHRGKEKYWKEQPVILSKYANIFKNKFPKLRAFGFDIISLTSKLDREEGKRAHIEFLINNDIIIIEDMHLMNLINEPNKLIVAPLLINDADGTPCTIIAFND